MNLRLQARPLLHVLRSIGVLDNNRVLLHEVLGHRHLITTEWNDFLEAVCESLKLILTSCLIHLFSIVQRILTPFTGQVSFLLARELLAETMLRSLHPLLTVDGRGIRLQLSPRIVQKVMPTFALL